MSATPRLYFDDPTLLEFDATVIAHATFQGAPSVVLDRSAFYPEAGGQLGDTGALGAAVIRDVQVDDAGVVHHLVDGDARPAVGDAVRGVVDRARRRLHMALHTGQHMLSRALLDEAAAETVSSRLGQNACTIDVHLAALDEAAVARAEALVNAVVDDDRPVRAWFPPADVLATLPLRRAPKVTENVRVVDVDGFDVSPCGGTHCTRTAQVGTITITGLERYKGKMRVTFLAGRAARDELKARSQALVELGRSFSCGPFEAKLGVDKLRGDLRDAREALGVLRAREVDRLAAELLRARDASGDPRVVAVLEGEPVETLRALAAKLTAHPDTVALLASRHADGTQVIAARSADARFDCGAWLKQTVAAHKGRGGGRADSAEGRLPADVDWPAIARA